MSSRRSPRSPRSRSPPASRGRPRSPSSVCSPRSFCSLSVGAPRASSHSRSPVLCPGTSQESPSSLAPFQRAHCPLPWRAPTPGSCSAQGLGHGCRDQEPSLGVLAPGWVSDLVTCPGGGLYPQPAAWALPQPSPHCPQAPGTSRVSGELWQQTQVGVDGPGRKQGRAGRRSLAYPRPHLPSHLSAALPRTSSSAGLYLIPQ